MKNISILGADTKIEVEILDRLHPESIGSWEGDWVKASIAIEIPGYSAAFPAELRLEELRGFREQIESMNESLDGEASWVSIDHIIETKATMDFQGGIYWETVTRYPVGSETALCFTFSADQSYLAPLIRQLDEVLEEFPLHERKGNLKTRFTKFLGKKDGSEKD